MPTGIFERTDEYKAKMKLACKGIHKGRPENTNGRWLGDNVGVRAVHIWVEKWKGKPNHCENCGTTKNTRYEWANIDHQYHRLLDDYIRLCVKCHSAYDRKMGLRRLSKNSKPILIDFKNLFVEKDLTINPKNTIK